MSIPKSLAPLAIACLLAAGCKKGADADVAPLEKAFGQKATGTDPAQQQVADLVNSATEAAKKNDYPKAAASLTVLRAQPGLTPDQRSAVQDTMGNIQTELARRAEAGDATAKQMQEELRQMKRR